MCLLVSIEIVTNSGKEAGTSTEQFGQRCGSSVLSLRQPKGSSKNQLKHSEGLLPCLFWLEAILTPLFHVFLADQSI